MFSSVGLQQMRGLKGKESADKLAKENLENKITLRVPLGNEKGRSWDEDQKGRGIAEYKSLIKRISKETDNRKGMSIERPRVAHTGLNVTLFFWRKRTLLNV